MKGEEHGENHNAYPTLGTLVWDVVSRHLRDSGRANSSNVLPVEHGKLNHGLVFLWLYQRGRQAMKE